MNQAPVKILQPTSLLATASPAHQFDELLKTTHFDTLLETHPTHTMPCQPPMDISHTPQENQLFFGNPQRHFKTAYPFPASYVVALPHSRLVGEGYILISGRNEVISESFSGDQVLQKSGHFLRKQLKIDLGGGLQTVPFVLFREHSSSRLIEQPCILPTHYWHFNYHHWLVEVLPRLRIALETPELADCPIIVPQQLKSFQRESLTLLGIPANRLFPFDGQDWPFRNLIFPSIGVFAPHELRWVRDGLLAGMGITTNSPATEGLYYVTRRDTTNRQVINEDEVIRFLSQRGFEIITLTGMPLQKQIERFASAKIVIGPHGAGLTNMLFAPPDATLIELMPNDQVNHCFWVIANAIDHHYTFIAGQQMNEQRDFIVPIERLQQILLKVM